MLPTREEAERILVEAEECNPGPWGNHSRVVAVCAERIAGCVEGMDAEKAGRDIYEILPPDTPGN